MHRTHIGSVGSLLRRAMMKGMTHAGTQMHTVSYAGNVITRDEGAFQEDGAGILVWSIGIWSHNDEGYERGKERARGTPIPLSCWEVIYNIRFDALQGHLVQHS